VLFDLDGVLLKSMEQHLEAWRESFSRFKATVKEEDFYQLEGRGVRRVVETLVKKYNIDPKYKSEILQDKINYYNRIFKPIFYDGIFPLLDTLKERGVLMAVVTGGMRDRVQEILSINFKDYFHTSITSDDVKNTKPYPEPYLKGAAALNLRPDQCIVIENAPLGIKSGNEAGMYVVAITTTLKSNLLKEADIILDSFDEIKEHLTSLLNEKYDLD
jgi:beta-phosphoglucomutase